MADYRTGRFAGAGGDSGAALGRYSTSMLRRFLFALLGLQLLDLFLLIWLSRSIGFWQTLAIVVSTGIIGSSLARREAARVWQGWQAALAERRAPADGILDGMLVLLGGALLVAPGLATDVVGLCLFFPPSRRRVAAFLRRRMQSEFDRHPALGVPFSGLRNVGSRAAPRAGAGAPSQVIDTTGVETGE